MNKQLFNITNSGCISDLHIEIRKVDKLISVEKLKVHNTEQELINLEKKIARVNELLLKAQITLKDTEKKHENTQIELKNVHDTFNTLFKFAKNNIRNISDEGNDYIEQLKDQKNDLQNRLAIAEAERIEVATKLNEVELQISIQKVYIIFYKIVHIIYNFYIFCTYIFQQKKNAAILLRLQKNLEESLQEEKLLADKLKSNT